MPRSSTGSRRARRSCSSASPRLRRREPRTRPASGSASAPGCPECREGPMAPAVAAAPVEAGREVDMAMIEILGVALEALRVNKLRSFLTMLGIVIGVAAVIAMVALGRGAQDSVKQRIASLVTTLLTVIPGQARGPGLVASASDRSPLTLDDAAAIEDRALLPVAIQPEMSRSLQVVYGSRNTNTTVAGVTSKYPEVRRFTVDAGRMFGSADDAARRRGGGL